MAFIMIRLDIPGKSVGDLNGIMDDSTKPHEGVNELINLLSAINGSCCPAEVATAIRDTTQAITAAGGGETNTYNLK